MLAKQRLTKLPNEVNPFLRRVKGVTVSVLVVVMAFSVPPLLGPLKWLVQ